MDEILYGPTRSAACRASSISDGRRVNVRFAISYIAEWLAGNRNVLIDDHIEDTAMAELCRSLELLTPNRRSRQLDLAANRRE